MSINIPSVAVMRAVSRSRLELLLYVLMVDFHCVAQAGKLVHTTSSTGPTEVPRVTKETDASGFKLELNVSWRTPRICRKCRRDFFRPEVADERHRFSRCNQCQPCTVCAYDERLTSPCTSIQDTECTPLCGDDLYLDRVTRTCQRKIIIKHELVVEESTDVTTIGSKTEITVLTDRVTNQPSVDLQKFGRANQGKHSSSNVVDAESEESSPAYLTSLFVSGAAGIAVLVLLVFFSVYVVLRVKQWWNYKMAHEDRGPCRCTLQLPCCAHCKHTNSSRSSYVTTDYSTTGNRNFALRHGHQQRRTPVGIRVTRVKATAESKSPSGVDSKECQEGSVHEFQRSRQTVTELSQINEMEHGIENTARTSL